MTPRDPDLYTRYGLPSTVQEPAGSPTRAAIEAFRAWRDDPIFIPMPTPGQVRLLAEYCQDYISAQAFVFPKEIIADLRAQVVYIKTLDELMNWLEGCRKIGLWPL
jgi:hypothetical protein